MSTGLGQILNLITAVSLLLNYFRYDCVSKTSIYLIILLGFR